MSGSLIQLLPEQGRERAVAQYAKERISGVTGTTLTTTKHFLADVTCVFKNGTLMDPSAGTPAYTMTGKTITLNVAAVGGDVYWITGWFRGD